MKTVTLLAALALSAGTCWGQLEGVIDVHAHVDPETIPPSVEAMDLARMARKEGMRGASRVPVSRDGKLLPEVLQAFEIMARENLALAAGHANPEDTLLLIRGTREAGIDRIVVTHPVNRLSIEQQQEGCSATSRGC